jgi:RNA polymerase sigma-70 factor (ECF subfamily)
MAADPLFADAVDEAIGGDPLADSPEARPERPIAPGDFPSFYVRHRSALDLHARRFLDDPHEVEDVVQETFLKLFLAVPEIETELQALAFSRRVMTNLCIDRYRARKRRPAVINLDQGTAEEVLAEDEPADPVIQAEDAAVVRQALGLLTPLHRAALVKREVEEKPLPVIAEELGIPEDSVKHLLFRARRALRRLLVGTTVDPDVPLESMTLREALAAAPRRVLTATGALLVILLVVATGAVVRGTASTPAVSNAGGPVLGGGSLPTGTPAPGHRSRKKGHTAAGSKHHAASHRSTTGSASQPPASTAPVVHHHGTGTPGQHHAPPQPPKTGSGGHRPKPPTHPNGPPSGPIAKVTGITTTANPTVTPTGAATQNSTGTAITAASQLVATTTQGTLVLNQSVTQSAVASESDVSVVPLVSNGSNAVLLSASSSSSFVKTDAGVVVTADVQTQPPAVANGINLPITELNVTLDYTPDLANLVSETVMVSSDPTASATATLGRSATPSAQTLPNPDVLVDSRRSAN